MQDCKNGSGSQFINQFDFVTSSCQSPHPIFPLFSQLHLLPFFCFHPLSLRPSPDLLSIPSSNLSPVSQLHLLPFFLLPPSISQTFSRPSINPLIFPHLALPLTPFCVFLPHLVSPSLNYNINDILFACACR